MLCLGGLFGLRKDYKVYQDLLEGSSPKFPCNPLTANPIKWSNTFKQFVGKLPPNCLSVFDHFVKLALKGLILSESKQIN